MASPATDSLTPTGRRAKRCESRNLAQSRDLMGTGRPSSCGTALGAAVSVVQAATGVHVVGTETCSSVHVCPWCAPIIRQSRADLLAQAIARHQDEGGECFFVTLTASHHEHHSLESSLDALMKTWKAITSGRCRQRMDSIGGMFTRRLLFDEDTMQPYEKVTRHLGIVRAVDLTHGVNGWHPHYHCVVFTRPGTKAANVWRAVVMPWIRSSAKVSGRSALAGGCDVKHIARGEADAAGVAVYGMKAACEVMRIDTKTAGSGEAPWSILARAIDGEVDARALWAEYRETMKGRRAAVWSRALREWFLDTAGPEADDPDREEADTELGAHVVVFSLTAASWRYLRRSGAEGRLYRAVEHGTWRLLLDQLDIAWLDPPPPALAAA